MVPAPSAGMPGVAISHVVLVLRETMRCEGQHQHNHQAHGTTTRHGTPQHTGPTSPVGMAYHTIWPMARTTITALSNTQCQPSLYSGHCRHQASYTNTNPHWPTALTLHTYHGPTTSYSWHHTHHGPHTTTVLEVPPPQRAMDTPTPSLLIAGQKSIQGQSKYILWHSFMDHWGCQGVDHGPGKAQALSLCLMQLHITWFLSGWIWC